MKAIVFALLLAASAPVWSALAIQSILHPLTTSVETESITITSFGTPVAAMFVTTRAAAADDHAADAGISIGFYDGTRSRSFGFSMNNGDGTPDADRLMSDASVGVLALNSTIDTAFSGNGAFVTDGVSISMDDAPPAAFETQVTLFGGTDIANVYVGHGNLGTGTSAVPFEDPTFQADLVFVVGVAAATAITGDDLEANASLALGVWSRDDATQMYCAMSQANGGSSSNSTNRLQNDEGIGQTVWVGPGEWFGTFSAHANGFQITPSVNAGSDRFAYLAIEWSVVPTIEIVESTLPASAIDWTESGFSAFTPGWGMSCITSATAANTTLSGAEDMTLTVATIESGQVLSSGTSDDDGAGTTLNSSWAKETFFTGDPDGTAVLSEGTLQSIQSGGWTIDLGGDTHDSIARKGWSLAIDLGGGGGSDTSLRRRRAANDDEHNLDRPLIASGF